MVLLYVYIAYRLNTIIDSAYTYMFGVCGFWKAFGTVEKYAIPNQSWNKAFNSNKYTSYKKRYSVIFDNNYWDRWKI